MPSVEFSRYLHVAEMQTGIHHCKKVAQQQGLKKVLSGGPGQLDFCVGQVTFPTPLPSGQGYGQAARELS